jgi:hypothetical protein
MVPWFIANKPFSPENGERWEKYVTWSGLTQLEEVVSLDGMLCPTLLPEIKNEYWPHIVNEDFMLNFFVNFDFLMGQVAEIPEKNVLCVFRNPTHHPQPPSFANFKFLGYDLVDRECSVSALTNCGGFPDVFANSELSTFGLLPNFERAAEVQKMLHAQHPEEHHANCHAWALFRLVL